MNPEQLLYLASILCALAAVGCSTAGFLADSQTTAGYDRKRKTSFTAALLFLGAAGCGFAAGESAGYSTGVIWFIFAMYQVTQLASMAADRAEIARRELAEQQQALQRETEHVDHLAAKFNLPPMPRIQPERNQDQ